MLSEPFVDKMFALEQYLITFSALLLGYLYLTEGKQVETIYGPVNGNTVTLDDGTVINNWYGIRYARPPVGDLRFEPPQPPAVWTDVFDATELPYQCIQNRNGLIEATHPGWTKFSEDCLSLNIFAPDDMTEAPLPVMVWIHGGAYIAGGNIKFPGHFLAARGVVVVVPNYRVGAFGFLSSADNTVRGNMAMFDQAMALRWVRDNIANFGGNPSKVTIFGESAGACSTALHTVSPYSRGLFHQAIIGSGSATATWSISYPEYKPDNYLYQLAYNTGCLLPTDAEIVECLRSLPPFTIQENQGIFCEPGYNCVGWAPKIDGPNGFLPKLPIDLKNEQTPQETIPIIQGICREDGSMRTTDFVPEALYGGFNGSMFDYFLRYRFLALWAPQFTQKEIDNLFATMRFNYAPWPYLDDLEGNRQAFNKITTDSQYGYPFDSELKLNAAKNPNTYGYLLSYLSPNASYTMPPWMGVFHTADIPYIWGYPKMLKNPDVRENCGMNYDVIGWVEDDIKMADFVITLWTNFAKYGNPTPEPVKSPFDDTTVTWDKFSTEDDVKILDINWQMSMLSQYRQRDYALYTDYIPYLINRRPPTTANVETSKDLKRFASSQSSQDDNIAAFAKKLRS